MKLLYFTFLVSIIFSNPSWADVNFKIQTIEASLEQAKEENKLLFVVFSAENCPGCKLMKKNVYPDPDLSQTINNNFIPMENDGMSPVSKLEALQYGVSILPTMMFLDQNGKAVRKIEGKKSLVEMKGIVAQMINPKECTSLDKELVSSEDFCCSGLETQDVNGKNVCIKQCLKDGSAFRKEDGISFCCEGLVAEFSQKNNLYTCTRRIECTMENENLTGLGICCEGLVEKKKKDGSSVCRKENCVDSIVVTYPYTEQPSFFKGDISDNESHPCCNSEARRKVGKTLDGYFVLCFDSRKLEVSHTPRSFRKDVVVPDKKSKETVKPNAKLE